MSADITMQIRIYSLRNQYGDFHRIVHEIGTAPNANELHFDVLKLTRAELVATTRKAYDVFKAKGLLP